MITYKKHVDIYASFSTQPADTRIDHSKLPHEIYSFFIFPPACPLLPKDVSSRFVNMVLAEKLEIHLPEERNTKTEKLIIKHIHIIKD